MRENKPINQVDVWKHWFMVERPDEFKKLSGFDLDKEINCWRCDIKCCLPKNLQWYEAKIENDDISKMYIISSDDWKTEGFCKQDFKLITAISNYSSIKGDNGKYNDIKQKENFLQKSTILDTKLIIVAPSFNGPFTIIEGNRRAIALGNLNKLNSLDIFFGISEAINNYKWARYSNK